MTDNTPTLDEFWLAFKQVVDPALEEYLPPPLYEQVQESMMELFQTSFYAGAESVVSALIAAQHHQGADITTTFLHLADQCETYLSQFHADNTEETPNDP